MYAPRTGDTADTVDPRVAERLIREVLGEGSTNDIDGSTHRQPSCSCWLAHRIFGDGAFPPESVREHPRLPKDRPQ
jgi:hypothetical protein